MTQTHLDAHAGGAGFEAAPDEAAHAIGARVAAVEAAALTALSESLGGPFDHAVALMAAATGRIVVSGMGKSGHIGRKIAATLASTGAPAQFVHPAEASHGDLGMIASGDVALVLSNSGETAELFNLIEHARRFGVPLVGVAGRAGSTLLTQADAPLLLPPAPEACPLALAPTTSTTMTLALGDALAVALMVKRGFTAQEFRAYHPGGALGARLLTVGALMHQDDALPLVSEDARMSEAILTMTAKSFGVAGVVDAAGALVGIITDGDLRRHLEMGDLGALDRTSAGAMATRRPKSIAPRALAAEALATMNRLKISSLFVLEEGGSKPIGLIHIHDCLRAGLR